MPRVEPSAPAPSAGPRRTGPGPAAVRPWRRFLRDRSGNVAAIFALALVPLAGLTGAALDYSRATNARAQVQAALDAALMRAAKEAAEQGAGDVPAAKVEAAVKDIVAQTPWIAVDRITTRTTAEGGQLRRVRASFEGRVSTTVFQVMGRDSIGFAGESETTLERPTYNEIHLVVDVSASMGLAATDAGRRLLKEKTKEINDKECTFACHMKDDPSHPKTNLQIAQDHGIRTRIDVVRSVANTLLDDVKAAQKKNVFGTELYEVGLYSFSGRGVDAGEARTLARPTDNVERVRPHIGELRLDNATAYKPMLRDMTRIIGKSEDGSRPNKRRKFMILLTDGHDYGHDWGQSKTINPGDCFRLKENGVSVYVFNTKWVADWGNWAFDPILGYKQNPLGGGTVFQALGPKLRECSSGEGFYFEGTDAGEIADKFREIFVAIANRMHVSH